MACRRATEMTCLVPLILDTHNVQYKCIYYNTPHYIYIVHFQIEIFYYKNFTWKTFFVPQSLITVQSESIRTRYKKVVFVSLSYHLLKNYSHICSSFVRST